MMIRFNEVHPPNKKLPYSSIRSEKSTDNSPVQFEKHNGPIPGVVVAVDGSNTILVSDATSGVEEWSVQS